MNKNILYRTINTNGTYTCGDIGISIEEWLGLLHNEKAKPYVDILLCFLREPEHKGTCSSLGLKYGKSSQHFNSKITSFSEWVQGELGRFHVLGTDGKPTYWCITMQYGRNTQQGFEWRLRDELIEALRIYLFTNLIDKYKKLSPFNGYNEEYKWALIDQTEGQNPIDIVKYIIGVNIVDNERVDPVFKYLISYKASEFEDCLNKLFDESALLDDRIAAFKNRMREICPNSFKNCANDERTAAAILTCKYPNTYTIYKDEIYQLICKYFGYEYRKPGYKFSHFMKIINSFTHSFGNEVQSIMVNELNKYRNKPLNLAIQTLFWCMRELIKNEMNNNKVNYWLVGFNFNNNESQIERFFSDCIWESWYNDDNKSDQNLLRLARSIKKGDILILKSTATKGAQHDIPFMRIKGFGVVESDIKITKTETATRCSCSVKYINKLEYDFNGSSFGSYRKTIHQADVKVQPIINYVNSIIYPEEAKSAPKYQQYIELLREARNLVLTGAPGTGKTYMAQAIAEEMGCGKEEMYLVQFHPSYDYTDFVEGLRPVEKADGQIGFERKDGVFKEFCKKAAKNLIDSYKTIESLTKEQSWEEQLQQFIENAIENNTKYELTNGNEFTIEGIKGSSIIVRNEQNEKTTLVSVSKDDIIELLTNDVQLQIVRDIRNYFNRKFGTQPDSYAFIIIKEIRKIKNNNQIKTVEKINRKDYVFIIDEINRGEASKIFGELFYAIDPGYRGKKDIRVKTQYQNLVPEGDLFSEGFYVPENVYILATMNDIDRSVENMDFAMRRRFTWQEITPYDTESMLDDLDYSDEVKATMHRLNKTIADTDGLGSAYAIGPSYFLKLRDNGYDMQKLWKRNIEPLLKEYLRGFRKLENILDKFRNAYFATTDNLENAESDELEEV